jgi:hypothetical protein
MFVWILQMTIISIIMIWLVHHLIGFFKSMLTIPKIKDLVDSPSQKYKNIFDQMNTNGQPNVSTSASYNKTDLLPKEDDMKKDLKSFLKKKLNANQSDNTTDIFSLDSSYSPYV